MFETILVLTHVFSAAAALLSGFLAVVLRKGSGLHGAAGTLFFATMIGMTTSAAYLALFVKPLMLNVVASLLTLYIVVTAWRAARRRQAPTDRFDAGALVWVAAVAVAAFVFGFRIASSSAPPPAGVPAPPYFIFGTVALLCAVNDVRMLRRGELSGARRLRRHLWRMSLALLIASVSLYPGQARLFPQWLRATNLLFIPHVLLFGSMLFWMARIRVRRSGSLAPSGAASTTPMEKAA